MATIKFKGNPIHTSGELPAIGSTAPDVALVKADLSEAKISSFRTKKVVSIFPSIDTGVCATSVRTFNKKVVGNPNVKVVNVSADLPFAQKRFCAAEGIENVETLSTFRSDFAQRWGVKMVDGPLSGLCARAVVVLDENDRVIYTELVPEVTQEPNYDAALAAVAK